MTAGPLLLYTTGPGLPSNFGGDWAHYDTGLCGPVLQDYSLSFLIQVDYLNTIEHGQKASLEQQNNQQISFLAYVIQILLVNCLVFVLL